MANYKVVDADQLDADLASVADAIRKKGGTSDQMAFPDGFKSAVDSLTNPGEYLASVYHKTATEIISNSLAIDIPNGWQTKNKSLTKIDLPLVTKTGYECFNYCDLLAEIKLPALKTLGASAFSYCYALRSIYLPSLETIANWGWVWSGCNGLEKAYFPKLTNIYGGDFNACKKLTALVLGADTVCTLGSTDTFAGTPIAGDTTLTNGEMGYIYVPTALVDSYKAATNWSTFADQIRAIEDYPEVLEGWE